jgi:hypothetical protein
MFYCIEEKEQVKCSEDSLAYLYEYKSYVEIDALRPLFDSQQRDRIYM